ncbi:acid protease [Fomitiporia mediterranea MF3/22]|uniref:acid protease n=1 Tax=Fomitiporia mediterranea (strain MF3/22) TaxID=694068 RepID=UPI0004408B2C|nr:acid protease [Fomitiporia mediterranea MF3/22]EJD02530.1 acid protease [Fomitiporia mediterranea MF3/22]
MREPYNTNVGIGSPPTFYTLIVDTGSANTWISARGSHPYKPTETSKESNRNLSIKYGTGTFRGKLWYDRVTLGGLVVENQGIGVADMAFGFEADVDGILGLGLVELTKESIIKDKNRGSDDGPESIPTILDNLFAQGKIPQKTVAISFDPMSTTIEAYNYEGRFHGVLTFGKTDPQRYLGKITYTTIPQGRSSSKHWSLEQRIVYGSPTEGVEILKDGIGVIDTGSSVVHLQARSFEEYRKASNAELNIISGLLSLSNDNREKLKSLFFEIGGMHFEIPPEEQIWPQALNDVAGGPPDDCYMVYVELASDSGIDISLINGFTWLQHFYTVLDAENRRIGIAKAASRNTWDARATNN